MEFFFPFSSPSFWLISCHTIGLDLERPSNKEATPPHFRWQPQQNLVKETSLSTSLCTRAGSSDQRGLGGPLDTTAFTIYYWWGIMPLVLHLRQVPACHQGPCELWIRLPECQWLCGWSASHASPQRGGHCCFWGHQPRRVVGQRSERLKVTGSLSEAFGGFEWLYVLICILEIWKPGVTLTSFWWVWTTALTAPWGPAELTPRGAPPGTRSLRLGTGGIAPSLWTLQFLKWLKERLDLGLRYILIYTEPHFFCLPSIWPRHCTWWVLA